MEPVGGISVASQRNKAKFGCACQSCNQGWMPPMSRHRRHCPLIRLLGHLGWQRDPERWSVLCRDTAGRRARIIVRLNVSGIEVTAPPDGVVLTVGQIGRLRSALADATRTLGRLTPDIDDQPEIPTAPVLPRRRVSMRPQSRPSVQDIAVQLENEIPSEGADHVDCPQQTHFFDRAA